MNKAAEIRQRLDELLLTHYHKLDTPGIFKGKMGACLYFFQAFHHQNDPRFGTAAESTVQEVYSFVHQNPVPSYFDNGLAGIAWGIHQLIKNGSLEGEADELLEQIDNILFKVISEKSEEIEFGVKRGLLGYLLYIFDRLAELSDIRDFHISRELFTSLATLLVNRIHLMVAYGKASFAEPNGFHVFWDLPNYLYVLAEAVKVGLLPHKINRMIKEITPIVLSSIPQNPGNSLNLYWSMRRLSLPEWENHASILINHVIEATFSSFELRNKALYVENGLAGLILLDAQIKREIDDYVSVFENTGNRQAALLHFESSDYWAYLSTNPDHELGFLYGISGISYSLLHLLNENP
ncbi:lanthionine synthetase LanC family protein [Lunatimonas salinarum]|uniref:lanthionine synthetase LanC family protein n=1 Tax=Lunatimonas salinarum TaxID=1774590 RepID=UPI001ADEE698|nr:lanthionine synthetase LanC family protein [Lunatimonas salinarum]